MRLADNYKTRIVNFTTFYKNIIRYFHAEPDRGELKLTVAGKVH